MKKLLALLLALVLALSMVACNGSTTPPANDGTDNGGTTDEGPTKTTPTSLKINGVDVSEYTIVYSSNPKKTKYMQYSKVVTEDTEYDKQTAEYLAAEIKEHFGATVKVTRDTATAKDKEILIGSTKRGLVDETLAAFTSDKDISIKESGGKLVLCGASFGATWQSVDAFIADCLAQDAETAEVKTGYTLTAKADLLVVACVGDSLTNGTKPSNYTSTVSDGDRRDIVAYPAVLQRIAWKTMTVYNYGYGGRTMTEDHYWDNTNDGVLKQSEATDRAWSNAKNCPYYTPCMENAENFDLVLLMLGTNDANSGRALEAGYKFDSTYEADFIKSCKNLVDGFKAKNSDVRVVLLNCPIAFRADVENYAANYIRKYQANAATQLGLTLIDMYTFTKNNTTSADYPDNLHPKDEGYAKYAKGIYEMITPVVNEMLGK